MGDVVERLALPRLVLRVGALGNRRFGRDNGIDEAPEALEQAARAACAQVLHEIAAAVVEVFVADRAHVLPPMDQPRRFWWETRLGLFFGRADVWRRRADAGQPAPAFRDESPLVSVLAGNEPGGDAFVAEAALAMNPTEPPAETERYVAFERIAVVVEDPDAPPSSRPLDDARTLSVGTIPHADDEVPRGGPAVRPRAEAREHAATARRRAFGFRAQSEALRHHADLLVAVWDPDAAGKAGGTLESVHAALEEHLPVVAIRVAGPGAAAIHLLQRVEDLRRAPVTPWASDLRACVKDLVSFPETPASRASEHEGHYSSYHPRAAFRAFHGAVLPTAPWPARFWPPLKAWMQRRRSFASVLAGFVGMGASPGEAAKGPPAGGAAAREAGPYDEARRRASAMSEAFGDAHRGGMLVAYALALLAVLLALLGLPLPHDSAGWAWIGSIVAILELLVLATLFALWRTSTLEDWHEAYTDTRILAEALRCMEPLAPLGVRVPLPKPARSAGPRGLDAGDPVPSDPRRLWSLWYYRALVREAPLRLPMIPRVPLAQYRDRLLTEWVGTRDGTHPGSQVAYHQRTEAAHGRLAHGIEHVAGWLFLVVLAAVTLHAFVMHAEPLGWLGKAFGVVSVVVPAVLAALSGFLAQIEAARIHKRSAGMVVVLTERARALAALDLSDPQAADARWLLATEAAATAAIMVEETAGWALIYKNADIRAG